MSPGLRGGPHWTVSESQLESSLTEPPRGLKGPQQPKAGEMPASYIQVTPEREEPCWGTGTQETQPSRKHLPGTKGQSQPTAARETPGTSPRLGDGRAPLNQGVGALSKRLVTLDSPATLLCDSRQSPARPHRRPSAEHTGVIRRRREGLSHWTDAEGEGREER